MKNTRNEKSDGSGAKTRAWIWIATLLVVVLILGGAYYVVHRGQGNAIAPAPQAQRKFAEQPAPPAATRPVVASKKKPPTSIRMAGTLRVRITDTPPGERIELSHTCYRENSTPPLQWSGAPPGTASLIAILEQRVPGFKPAWVWVLFNIDPKAGGLAAGLPKALEYQGGMRTAKNSYDRAEYAGPCEPKGKIPYALVLYALDIKVDLAGGVSQHDLMRATDGHVIDKAEYGFNHYFKL